MFENEYEDIMLYKEISLTIFYLSFPSLSLYVRCVLLLTRKGTFGMKENNDCVEI